MSGIVASVSIFAVLVTTARVNTGSKEYELIEYIMSSLTFIFILFSLVPSDWKLNSFWYVLGMIYFHEHTRNKYKNLPPSLTIGCGLSCIYILVAAYVL